MTRYLRQTLLSEIGREGQEALGRARVLCVGIGGLGAPAAMYLAASGVGTIGLVDGDQIEISNLQRQILFGESDVGDDKVEVAYRRLSDMNSTIKIEPHPFHIGAENVLELFRRYDLILDGTDNFSTKFLINDAALKLGLPVVHGAISQFEGRMSVFWRNRGPCYRCLHPMVPNASIPNCQESGVIGSVAGVIGSMMALEAVKVILVQSGMHTPLQPLLGELLAINMASMDILKVKVPWRENCLCRGEVESIVLSGGYTGCAVGRVPSIQEITETELEEHLGNGGAVFDVREESERLSGAFRQTRHWALSRMRFGEFPRMSSLDEPIICVCQNGIRSAEAASLFYGRGYRNVRSFAVIF